MVRGRTAHGDQAQHGAVRRAHFAGVTRCWTSGRNSAAAFSSLATLTRYQRGKRAISFVRLLVLCQYIFYPLSHFPNRLEAYQDVTDLHCGIVQVNYRPTRVSYFIVFNFTKTIVGFH